MEKETIIWSIIVGYLFSSISIFLILAIVYFFYTKLKKPLLFYLFVHHIFALFIFWATILAHAVICNGIVPIIVVLFLLLFFWKLRQNAIKEMRTEILPQHGMTLYLFAETGRTICFLALLTVILFYIG